MKLSKGVGESYLTGCSLPKKTHVVLEHRYAKAPVKENTKSIRSFFGKRGPPKDDEADSPENKKSRSEGDGTTTKRKKNPYQC